jgi:tRNA dimethylallyltransferase
MIEAGLVKEVEGLLNRGYKKELTSMQGLGYKQIINYLEGNYTLDTAIEEIKKLTRRYAKRQLTWFRQTEGIDWINLDEIDKEVQVDWIIMHIKKNLAL